MFAKISDSHRQETHYLKPVLALVFVISLGGCGSGQFDDLEEWTQQVSARKSGRVEPLPEVKPYVAYTYQGAQAGARDPFQPFFVQREAEQTDAADTGLTEEMERELVSRNREELERFELDSLRMVGTLQNADNNWAIISDPDGVVHRVTVGNYIGRNIGKIINIYENKVEVREIVKNSNNRWEERQAALALVEE